MGWRGWDLRDAGLSSGPNLHVLAAYLAESRTTRPVEDSRRPHGGSVRIDAYERGDGVEQVCRGVFVVQILDDDPPGLVATHPSQCHEEVGAYAIPVLPVKLVSNETRALGLPQRPERAGCAKEQAGIVGTFEAVEQETAY